MMNNLDSSLAIGELSAACLYILLRQTKVTSHYFQSSQPMRLYFKAVVDHALALYDFLASVSSTTYRGQIRAAICYSSCLGILYAACVVPRISLPGIL